MGTEGEINNNMFFRYSSVTTIFLIIQMHCD